MNIKKIGLSALAGSLAMVSANAVEYSMTGGAMSTFTTAKGDGINIVDADNGKGFGHATDLGFTARFFLLLSLGLPFLWATSLPSPFDTLPTLDLL